GAAAAGGDGRAAHVAGDRDQRPARAGGLRRDQAGGAAARRGGDPAPRSGGDGPARGGGCARGRSRDGGGVCGGGGGGGGVLWRGRGRSSGLRRTGAGRAWTT